MNIVLFGPPGAGKGTQADNLTKDLKLVKVSTGELLREEIKKKTTLGKEIKSIIDQGLLASNQITNSLIETMLSRNDYANRFIFDGYPRNIEQARNLDDLLKKYNQKISCVLGLKVDKEIIVKRILGRQTCSKCGLIFNKFFNPPNKKNYQCNLVHLKTRSDDNEQTIRNRFETFFKDTIPIINYYQKQNLMINVNGMGEIQQIYKEIRQIIDSLDT